MPRERFMHGKPFFIVVIFILSLLLIQSCDKEYSYEGGNKPLIAIGTLQDSMGNCKLIEVNGSYQPNVSFTNNNYIKVQANITGAGSYLIYTDTINGFYFMASGFINNTGLQTIHLKAYGQPLIATIENFTVHFNESICTFTIS